MARFVGSGSRVVRRAQVFARVDGALVGDARVVGIGARVNAASDAVVAFPTRYAWGPLLSMHGRELEVVEGGSVVFRGYIDADTAEEDAFGGEVRVTARNVMALLDRVYVGQATLRGEVVLPKTDPAFGGPSQWTFESVLGLLFGPFTLDSHWRQLVALGDVSALGRSRSRRRFPSMRWTGETVGAALRELLGLVPDVGVRFRYPARGGALIDFFAWNETTAGARRLRVPLNEGPENGAVVTGWSRRTESWNVRTRVLAYADRYRHQVTLHEEGGTLRMMPAWGREVLEEWVPATQWVDPLPDEEGLWPVVGPFPAWEDAVLRNPLLATEGSPGYREEYGAVFRRYQVPRKLLAAYELDAANLFEARDGSATDPEEAEAYARIPFQCFRPKYRLVEGEEPGESHAERVAHEYEFFEQASLDPVTGTLRLGRPNVAVLRTWADETGALRKQYFRPPLYLTVTLSANAVPIRPEAPEAVDRARGGYDTGVRAFSGVRRLDSGEGSVLSFVNSDVRFWVLGTFVEGLRDYNGTPHVLGTVFHDPQTGGWWELAPGDPELLVDERQFLATLAESALAERLRPRTDFRADMPLVLGAWRPGDGVRVTGRGVDGLFFNTAAVVVDYDQNRMRVTASDQVPPVTVLDAGVPGRSVARMGAEALGRRAAQRLAEDGHLMRGLEAWRGGRGLLDLAARGIGEGLRRTFLRPPHREVKRWRKREEEGITPDVLRAQSERLNAPSRHRHAYWHSVGDVPDW